MRVCLSLLAPAASHSRNSAKKNKIFSSRFGVLQAAQGKSPFVPAGPTSTEKTIFPSTLRQAFNWTHTSQEWHLTRQLRPSGLHQVRQKSVGKSVGLNLNDTIGYHKVWVCFSKTKRVWKNEQTRGLRSTIPTGASPIQQRALAAFEPPVEPDKRPKPIDHTGRTLHLGFLSWKSWAVLFSSQPQKCLSWTAWCLPQHTAIEGFRHQCPRGSWRVSLV